MELAGAIRSEDAMPLVDDHEAPRFGFLRTRNRFRALVERCEPTAAAEASAAEAWAAQVTRRAESVALSPSPSRVVPTPTLAPPNVDTGRCRSGPRPWPGSVAFPRGVPTRATSASGRGAAKPPLPRERLDLPRITQGGGGGSCVRVLPFSQPPSNLARLQAKASYECPMLGDVGGWGRSEGEVRACSPPLQQHTVGRRRATELTCA